MTILYRRFIQSAEIICRNIQIFLSNQFLEMFHVAKRSPVRSFYEKCIFVLSQHSDGFYANSEKKNPSKIRQFLARLPETSRRKNHVLSAPHALSIVCFRFFFFFFPFLIKWYADTKAVCFRSRLTRDTLVFIVAGVWGASERAGKGQRRKRPGKGKRGPFLWIY